jgi:hypothetical protein
VVQELKEISKQLNDLKMSSVELKTEVRLLDAKMAAEFL